MLKRQSSKAQLDLSTTVSKATSKEVKPPKEKHIRSKIFFKNFLISFLKTFLF